MNIFTDETETDAATAEESSVFADAKTVENNVVGAEKNRTAILLLDFQNEFMKKGGKLYDDVSETMETTGILRNVPKLVDFARKTNAMIIYSPVVMKETGHFDNSSELLEENSSEDPGATDYTKQFGLFTENTWNCEFIHELEPLNDDIILHDRADFNAFVGSKLLTSLKENGIKHFFVTGFLTDICVYRTATHAAKILPDMTTYVISDGCAATSIDTHNTALENISKKSVNIVSCSEATSLLTGFATSMKKHIDDGSDEWRMIEKIFSAAGVGANERIGLGKLESLIGSLPSSSAMLSAFKNTGSRHNAAGRRTFRKTFSRQSSSAILSIVSDSIRDTDDKSLSRKDMHDVLFKRKTPSGFLEKFTLFIIMILMPFLYSVSTRIPFIFVALEITVGRGQGLWLVAAVLGVYQTSRALGNLIIVAFGGKTPFKRLQILMIVSALSGWIFLSFYGREAEVGFFSFEPYFSDSQDSVRPLFALFWVGLCETVVLLQRALMVETAKESPSGIIDKTVLASRFSLQYGMVSFGSVVAFLVGGQLYTNFGYYAVCDFGILVQIAHLIAAITYLALRKKSMKNLKGDDLNGNQMIRSVIYQFQAVTVILKYSQDVANGTENALNSEVPGMSGAAIKAKSDRVLNHSLREMFQYFFTQKQDDIASMENLIKCINIAGNKGRESMRPHAIAIGKHKISKLVLFLMKSKGAGSLTETEFVSFWAPRIYLSMFESSQAASVDVTWPYMKAVVATQAIAALGIGTFLSTALLSYTERFDLDAATVGLFLAIGEAFGMVIILAKTYLPTHGNARMKSSIFGALTSRPLNVPFVLLLSSSLSMIFCIDNIGLAVACQLLYSSVNDLSVSLMNELIGTSLPADKFKYYQGIGQWLRRLGNMVTAICGPVFFGINEKLPFLFFGGIVLVWAFILWILMYLHAERIQRCLASYSVDDDNGEREEDSKSFLANSVLAEPFLPFIETTRTPWQQLEQRYYALNKERLEEELNTWKKAHVDISLMEHRIRRIAAALEVEKDQRRALEDRMYARVSTSESQDGNVS